MSASGRRCLIIRSHRTATTSSVRLTPPRSGRGSVSLTLFWERSGVGLFVRCAAVHTENRVIQPHWIRPMPISMTTTVIHRSPRTGCRPLQSDDASKRLSKSPPISRGRVDAPSVLETTRSANPGLNVTSRQNRTDGKRCFQFRFRPFLSCSKQSSLIIFFEGISAGIRLTSPSINRTTKDRTITQEGDNFQESVLPFRRLCLSDTITVWINLADRTFDYDRAGSRTSR